MMVTGGSARTAVSTFALGVAVLGALGSACAVAARGGAEAAGALEAPDQPPLGLDVLMPVPAGNPLTPAKIALGRRLFFEPRLSADGRISCASCHRPDAAFADATVVSPGAHGRTGERNTPSILNAAYLRHLMWDGRSATLEEQVLLPIANEVEMASSVEDAVAMLRRSRAYRSAFRSALGGEPSAERLSEALASFVRSLRAGDSPLDRYRAGDRSALSPAAERGFMLFVGKGRCATCHVGALLTDQAFHNTGVAWRGGRAADAGRAVVSGVPADSGAFRTPSLRNAALTAPYMHDGSIATLEEMVEFYDGGGIANPYLSPEIRPLRLTPAEREDLVALLRSLTSPPAPTGRDR